MLRAPVDPLVCFSNGVQNHRTQCIFHHLTRTHQPASYRRRTRARGPATRFHAPSYRVLATLPTCLVLNETLEGGSTNEVWTYHVQRAMHLMR